MELYRYCESSRWGLGKDGENEHVFMLSLSLPLSQWLPNTYANYNVTGNNKNSVSHQVGLNGRLLQNNNLNWNIQQSVDESGGSTGGMRDWHGTRLMAP